MSKLLTVKEFMKSVRESFSEEELNHSVVITREKFDKEAYKAERRVLKDNIKAGAPDAVVVLIATMIVDAMEELEEKIFSGKYDVEVAEENEESADE